MTTRTKMGGKPVFEVPSKTIINFESGFKEKLLCDGPTFSTGTSCQYSCAFCYVPSAMNKQKPWLKEHGVEGEHEDVVIRRANALAILRSQLTDSKGRPKFLNSEDHVIYASPLVDVAANMELVQETIEACKIILELTHWEIRLLSKSNLLPKIAQGLGEWNKDRIIYGVSTGTFDDKLCKAFEQGTPLVSKRLESLYWLQDHGYRTFGMICPSLPHAGYSSDYAKFGELAAKKIRAEKCEHVWAEVINVRGDSFTRTEKGLRDAGFVHEADELQCVTMHKASWEDYARKTFMAHVPHYRPGQLRFLQYVTKDNYDWWKSKEHLGAVLLGKLAHS